MTKRSSKYQPAQIERELQSVARSRAEQQRRLVSAETLEQTVAEYIEWEALILWVRAIVTANRSAPPMVLTYLQSRCPGFLEYESSRDEKDDPPHSRLWSGLFEWLEFHIFTRATAEGWFGAVSFYARRDERLKKVWSYWRQCQQQWGVECPVTYPGFEEWRRAAAAA
jgi:hypothetical protein